MPGSGRSGPDPTAGTYPPYAVVDLDGTVADVRHRLHHVRARPKNWDAFFAAAVHDPVLSEGAAVAAHLAHGHELVYLTGRPERCRADTEAWLNEHGLPAARVLMRRAGDRRPARVTKLETLRRLARERPVAVLVDDDAAVVAVAHAAGFAVLHATWMGAEPGPDGQAGGDAARATLLEAQERDGRT